MNRLRGIYALLLAMTLLFFASCRSVKDFHPDAAKYPLKRYPKTKIYDSLVFKGPNSLRLNSHGQWEAVVTGNPYELGDVLGDLTQNLLQDQEHIFWEQVEKIVPSKFKQYLLRKFLAWYTRDMDKYLKNEYKTELYGVSQYLSNRYDFIGSKYHRMLYLHAAHDIGHAIQDLALVGCSSFAVWGDHTPDGKLLVARVFDFNIGDDFAKEKTITFIDPKKGYRFVSISWGGFIGVMSGMNEKGLTVTINAGRSDIPKIAKNPISIVALEIVQYAANIDEAIAIAKEKEVFVSEAIMVGSATDNRAVLIEISPEKFGVFEVKNTSELICSNHFQSDAFTDDENNRKRKEESHSIYRYNKMQELLTEEEVITPQKAVHILRNTSGLDGESLGYGNEKALNQLAAHHAVVFIPEKKMIWVSANPYQLGAFVAFQLDSVFKNRHLKNRTLSLKQFLIPEDPFLKTDAYRNFERFKEERKRIKRSIESGEKIPLEQINDFIGLNPDFWEVYYITGLYYFDQKYYFAALKAFEKALTKEVTTVPDKRKIEDYIKRIKKKLGDTRN